MSDEPPTAPYTLRVRPGGWHVPAPADRTLLQSLLAAGATLPSSCRNGTCRTCLCRLLEGTVTYRIAWPGLLPEERTGGWVLPCCAYPASDVEIEAPAAARPA
jgi:ferredoxin